jgi:hypothetical protein
MKRKLAREMVIEVLPWGELKNGVVLMSRFVLLDLNSFFEVY